jgi:hypothetical protein
MNDFGWGLAIAARGEAIADNARDGGHRGRRSVPARLGEDGPRHAVEVATGKVHPCGYSNTEGKA